MILLRDALKLSGLGLVTLTSQQLFDLKRRFQPERPQFLFSYPPEPPEPESDLPHVLCSSVGLTRDLQLFIRTLETEDYL